MKGVWRLGKTDPVTSIEGIIVDDFKCQKDDKPRLCDSGPGRLLWVRVVWGSLLEEVISERQ